MIIHLKIFAGRKITFSRTKIGDEQYEIVRVIIQHNTDSGVLTIREIDELEVVIRTILTKLGFSTQDVIEKVRTRIAEVLPATNVDKKADSVE